MMIFFKRLIIKELKAQFHLYSFSEVKIKIIKSLLKKQSAKINLKIKFLYSFQHHSRVTSFLSLRLPPLGYAEQFFSGGVSLTN